MARTPKLEEVAPPDRTTDSAEVTDLVTKLGDVTVQMEASQAHAAELADENRRLRGELDKSWSAHAALEAELAEVRKQSAQSGAFVEFLQRQNTRVVCWEDNRGERVCQIRVDKGHITEQGRNPIEALQMIQERLKRQRMRMARN